MRELVKFMAMLLGIIAYSKKELDDAGVQL